MQGQKVRSEHAADRYDERRGGAGAPQGRRRALGPGTADVRVVDQDDPGLPDRLGGRESGAIGMHVTEVARRSDYSSTGAGRIDVYNLAGDRSSGQVEQNFQSRVGADEYGQIYVVYSGPGWKKGGG